MAVNNSIAKPQNQQRLSMSAYLSKTDVRQKIIEVIGAQNVQRFVSSIVSAVQATPTLKECTNQSILSAALLGEALKLSPSPQLGQFYIVPYENKDGVKEAQFQLGYRGLIQLAIRSGQYKKLNVIAIKQGELDYFDPINEEIRLKLMIGDWDKRDDTPTIGYYAFFELLNGYKKAIYWSKTQMVNHADKFSPAFSKDGSTVRTRYGEKKKVSFADYEAGNYDPKESWMYSSFWYRGFDAMAFKTMLRQIITKWGVISLDMQSAFDADMGVINDDGSIDYVDSFDEPSPLDITDILDVQPVEIPQESPAAPAVEKNAPDTEDPFTAAFFQM